MKTRLVLSIFAFLNMNANFLIAQEILNANEFEKNIPLNLPSNFKNKIYYYYDNTSITTNFENLNKKGFVGGYRDFKLPNNELMSALFQPEYYFSLDSILMSATNFSNKTHLQELLYADKNDIMVELKLIEAFNFIIQKRRICSMIMKYEINIYSGNCEILSTIHKEETVSIKYRVREGWMPSEIVTARKITARNIVYGALNQFFNDSQNKLSSGKEDAAVNSKLNPCIYNYLLAKARKIDSAAKVYEQQSYLNKEYQWPTRKTQWAMGGGEKTYKVYGVRYINNMYPFCYTSASVLREVSAKIKSELAFANGGTKAYDEVLMQSQAMEQEILSQRENAYNQWQKTKAENWQFALEMTNATLQGVNQILQQQQTANQIQYGQQSGNNQNQQSSSQNSNTQSSQQNLVVKPYTPEKSTYGGICFQLMASCGGNALTQLKVHVTPGDYYFEASSFVCGPGCEKNLVPGVYYYSTDFACKGTNYLGGGQNSNPNGFNWTGSFIIEADKCKTIMLTQ